MANTKQPIKFLPTLATSLIFLSLLSLVMLLFAGRTMNYVRSDYLQQLFPNFYQHISNFSISWCLYAGVGYMWLLMGVNLKYIMGFGGVILIINLIYELWIPVLNTKDSVDAYYGIVGVLTGFIFLVLVKRFGLKVNP